jgi:hypothetical protein
MESLKLTGNETGISIESKIAFLVDIDHNTFFQFVQMLKSIQPANHGTQTGPSVSTQLLV